MSKIPVSVLITTKNEEKNIARCLGALQDFAQIIVIDSHSADKTCEIARDMGAQIVLYQWDGKYPKKRGWCLENLEIAHDWVFWVDADEVVTSELVAEIRAVFDGEPRVGGFFVRGSYVWEGAVLRCGLQNNKIALFNRHKMEFPVIDDLDIEGMGEIEGHYQPVFKNGIKGMIGQLKAPLLHYAYEDKKGWEERHIRYANWEAQMNKRGSWAKDPIWWREMLKKRVRKSIFRPYIVFLYSYFIKFGFLDGKNGYNFAISRKNYCHLVIKAFKAL